jgi:hypothetical protein
MFICENCNKSFDDNSDIENHKSVCFEIKKQSSCEFCNKNILSKNLSRHLLICKSKKQKDNDSFINSKLLEFEELIKNKDNQIQLLLEENNKKNIRIIYLEKQLQNELDKKELEKEIAHYKGRDEILSSNQECLNKIAMQPRNNNNIFNNLSVFDKDVLVKRLTESMSQITPEQLYEGQKAVAKIVAPCLNNDDGTKMLSCSDKSRGVFAMKDKDGKINKDNGQILVEVIHPIVITKADEIKKEDEAQRQKRYDLSNLKKNIEKREREISEFQLTMKGFKANTSQYRQHEEYIKYRERKNKEDYDILIELQNDGVEEINSEDFLPFDEQLEIGIDDIETMKSDSKRFRKTLSDEI